MANSTAVFIIFVTFGWSSGWGQVMSGQTRSNCEVGLKKVGIYLIQFMMANSTAVFIIFVDGLDLPQIAIQNCVICSFRVFLPIRCTKTDELPQNFAWASQILVFITSIPFFYSKKVVFLCFFYFFKEILENLKILKLWDRHFVALVFFETCWLFWAICFKNRFLVNF